MEIENRQTAEKEKLQLICLPYSGGSSFAFQPLAAYWPKNWQVFTATYSGRGHRIGEPLLMNMSDLLQDTWKQIKALVQKPYVLFGHSLGSTLAYLLAHKAIDEGYLPPKHLFLCGTDAPSILPKLPYRYLYSKKDFKTELNSYGGISKEILNDENAFDFFEPIIRADLQTVETWQYIERQPLNICATIITGTEETMKEAEILTWQKEFSTEVVFKKMKGKHFFLFDNPRQFVDLLRGELQKKVVDKIINIT